MDGVLLGTQATAGLSAALGLTFCQIPAETYPIGAAVAGAIIRTMCAPRCATTSSALVAGTTVSEFGLRARTPKK